MPDADFWLDRWQRGETGWHQATINPVLEQHLRERIMSSGETVFVPLCGKCLDMLWFLEQGMRVRGVELSELAVTAFFEDNGLAYRRTREGAYQRFTGDDIEILVGDYFALDPDWCRDVTLVYDRGALVAMDPRDQQGAYVAQMQRLLPQSARILLLTIDYQGGMQGPPFAVSAEAIEAWFGDGRRIDRLVEEAVDDARFIERGVVGMTQRVQWLAPN